MDIHFAICIHVVVYAKTCISPMQLFIMKLNYFLKMNCVGLCDYLILIMITVNYFTSISLH